jgi:hypothetical protein
MQCGMTKERWKPIIGYEGHYYISDHGRVWSCRAGRVISPGTTPRGYRVIGLRVDGQARWFQVHRLVLNHFVGPCPAGMVACHEDDVPGHNHVSNLRWDTHKNNVAENSFAVGAKAARQEREKIRELRRLGVPIRQLMSMFDVSRATVYRILGPSRKSERCPLPA